MKNREIKFRAWDELNKKWVYFVIGENWSEIHLMVYHRIILNGGVFYQFTGLKDKNGMGIYEGDQLFVCPGYSSTVEFKDGCFVSVYRHPEDGEILPLIDVVGEQTEVI